MVDVALDFVLVAFVIGHNGSGVFWAKRFRATLGKMTAAAFAELTLAAR